MWHPGCQAEPYRDALRVGNDVDLGRKLAARPAETLISSPFFCRRSLLCARMRMLSIVWIVPSRAALVKAGSRFNVIAST